MDDAATTDGAPDSGKVGVPGLDGAVVVNPTDAGGTAVDGAADAPMVIRTGGVTAVGGAVSTRDGGNTDGVAATGGVIAPKDAGSMGGVPVLVDGGASPGGAAATGGVPSVVDADVVATGGAGVPADTGIPDSPIGPGGQPADARPDLGRPRADAAMRPDTATMKLVWFDEFSGEANTRADDSKWTYVQWEPGSVNSELQRYTNRVDNGFLDGEGHLVIHPMYTPMATSSNRYTSARIETSGGKFSFRTGRIEVRAKLPSGKGSFPGIILLGNRGSWPDCGELALVEQWGQDKSWFYSTAYAPTEATGDSGKVKYTFDSPTAASAEFHTYALNWYEDRVVFYVDDETILEKAYNSSSPFAEIPAYIVLDVALGGSMGGAVDNTAFAADKMDMVVDYVRVYSF